MVRYCTLKVKSISIKEGKDVGWYCAWDGRCYLQEKERERKEREKGERKRGKERGHLCPYCLLVFVDLVCFSCFGGRGFDVAMRFLESLCLLDEAQYVLDKFLVAHEGGSYFVVRANVLLQFTALLLVRATVLDVVVDSLWGFFALLACWTVSQVEAV